MNKAENPKRPHHVFDAIREDAAVTVAIRRHLHAHPELGFEEHRTSDLIASTLSGWGIPIHRGLGKTGIVGILKSGDSKRAVGLRADIDALAITERNAFEYKSTHAGKMHACGHDGHTAMLLAAAQYLSKHREFDGTIYLIFQPAEEGIGGARQMIKDGLFERFPMDAIFGIHNWPGLKVGQFAIKPGPIFGSSNAFKIVIRGKGAHTAFPHEGTDPIPVACQIVQAFQSIITRNKRPTDHGLISVTVVRAGEANNITPEHCEIQGSVRTFSLELLDLIERRMRRIAKATCQAFEATCEFEFDRICPSTINHPRETEFVRQLLIQVAGEENVLEFEPTTGAEDFSYYLLEKPGSYFVIGNGDAHSPDPEGAPCGLHNPFYDFNDELIPIGASMWVRLATSWLADRAAAS